MGHSEIGVQKGPIFCLPFAPQWFPPIPNNYLGMYGGDDGARTRDLCRDSTEVGRNLLKLRATDGFFWRSEVPMATVIGPLSDPDLCPVDLCPNRRIAQSQMPWLLSKGDCDFASTQMDQWQEAPFRGVIRTRTYNPSVNRRELKAGRRHSW